MDINEIIESAKRHRDADDYVRGTFGEVIDGRFRGCSVGCTIRDIDSEADTNDHAFLAEKLNVPEALIHLQDYFFENLNDNRDWTVNFLSAIPTTPPTVITKFLLKIVPVVDAEYYRLTKEFLEDWIATGVRDESKAQLARAAESAAAWSARSAERSSSAAAWSAESAAAWSAERSSSAAARAAERSSSSAARAAESAAAWSAERSSSAAAANKRNSEILLEIMRGK